jgi:hypothetical protein
MLSFKEYSQLNESPDVAAHIIRHIVNHPKLKDLADNTKVHVRAAKHWWDQHSPDIVHGYTGAADADKSAPDSGGPAIVHTLVNIALEAREGWKLIKSYREHVETARDAIKKEAKQKYLGFRK